MPLIKKNKAFSLQAKPWAGLAIGLLCTGLLFNNAAADDLPLMPYPKQVVHVQGSFILDEQLSIEVNTEEPEPLLTAEIERFIERLQRQTGIALSDSERQTGGQLVINIEHSLAPYLQMEQMATEQERYRLEITEERITLDAQTHLAARHGLQTLLQLIGIQEGPEVSLPGLRIDDEPRFIWRGLMLDSVRHFFSVETIKRQLDGMAAAKLNVFHWHLTDDQGWRLESRAYPKLHEEASEGHYYTREQVREIVAYAAERGIQVMPEIDMPGHSSAIGVAYPELMSAPGPYEMEDRWGVHRPLLDPSNDAVYQFAQKILAEVAELFPFDYVHIGGDEVDPRDWQENPEIQSFMRQQQLADEDALHAYFNQRLADILANLNRKMIGWDEVLHPDLPQHTAVQSWRGVDSLGLAAQAGHPAILSTGFYLDQPQPAGYHYRNRFFAQPLEGWDQASDNERWETWRFEFERKRGAPIQGQFTLIESTEGERRGFIDFEGRSRQRVHQLTDKNGITYFDVDTWMGPVTARVQRQGQTLGGDFVVGNAPYAVQGERITHSGEEGAQLAEGISPVVLDKADRQRILGGEIALWSEIINEDSIDRRLWPRGFAVAERLWSPAERRDEDSLYQRLQAVSQWSEISAGLKHQQQTLAAIERLVPPHQYELALGLSEAVEPAQYYHRHHEKSAYETYSRRDPLDRFVDSLPAESYAVRDWAQALDQWLKNPEDKTLYQRLYRDLQRWQSLAQSLLEAIEDAADPGALTTIAEQVRTTSTWGLILLESHQANSVIAPDLLTRARAQLRRAQQINEEAVVALAYPVERLLDKRLTRTQQSEH